MSALWLPLPIGTALLWLVMWAVSPLRRPDRSAPLDVPQLPPIMVQLLLGRGSLRPTAVEDIVADMADAGLLRIVERREGGAAVSPCDGPPARPARAYESLVLQRIEQRRGAMGEVPVSALGPGDGEFTLWWRDVTEAVTAMAARAGLVRQRVVNEKWLNNTGMLLWVIFWIAYYAMGLSGSTSAFAAFGSDIAAYVIVTLTLPGVRLTPEGRAAAGWWRAAGSTVRPPRATGPDRTWSAHSGTWREVEIEPRPVVIWGLRSHLVILVLFFGGVEALLLLPHRGFYGADQMVLGVLPIPVFGYLAARWVAANRRLHAIPAAVAFDGLVLRRWIVTHEDKRGRKSYAYYCAFDDGSSAKAWTFPVGKAAYDRLAVGDHVHVEANPRLHRLTAPIRSLQGPDGSDA